MHGQSACRLLRVAKFSAAQEERTLMHLPHDMKWCIVRYLPAADIQELRVLLRDWRNFLDGVSQEEWKLVYMAQVCDMLMVGASFDWKSAAIATSRHVNAVEAVCTWNKKRVRFAVPMRKVDDLKKKHDTKISTFLEKEVFKIVSLPPSSEMYFSVNSYQMCCAFQPSQIQQKCCVRQRNCSQRCSLIQSLSTVLLRIKMC